MPQTSEDLASLAARYLTYDARQFCINIGSAISHGPPGLQQFAENISWDIRRLAGSVLEQAKNEEGEAGNDEA